MINVDEVGEDGESRNDDGVDIHVDTAKTRVWKAVEEKRGGLAVRTQKGEVYIRTRAIGGCRSYTSVWERCFQRNTFRC